MKAHSDTRVHSDLKVEHFKQCLFHSNYVQYECPVYTKLQSCLISYLSAWNLYAFLPPGDTTVHHNFCKRSTLFESPCIWEVIKLGTLLHSSASHARCRHWVHSVMACRISFDSDCEMYVQKYSLWHSLTAYLLISHVGQPSSVPWLAMLSCRGSNWHLQSFDCLL
jgi:hypothetical protein